MLAPCSRAPFLSSAGRDFTARAYSDLVELASGHHHSWLDEFEVQPLLIACWYRLAGQEASVALLSPATSFSPLLAAHSVRVRLIELIKEHRPTYFADIYKIVQKVINPFKKQKQDMVGMLTHYLHMCESSVGSLFSIVIDSSWPIHKGFFMQGWLIGSVLYIFLLSLDSLRTAHMYSYSLNRYRRPVLTPSPLRIFHLWNCFKILNLWIAWWTFYMHGSVIPLSPLIFVLLLVLFPGYCCTQHLLSDITEIFLSLLVIRKESTT